MALADLAACEQVGFPLGWGVRTLTDSALRFAGVVSQVNLEVNDTNTLLDLLEAGLGVALIPEAIGRSIRSAPFDRLTELVGRSN